MDSDFHIPVELKQLISANQAFYHRIIPTNATDGSIHFFSDVSNLSSLEAELTILLDQTITIEYQSKEVIDSYLFKNYRKSSGAKNKNVSYSNNFLENLLNTSKDYGSSDIHLEPYENRCRVRLRLDGKLKEVFSIDPKEYPQIINQIKIKADLDISQKRLSQDGRISLKNQLEEFDIRVSTMPTLHGEKIVLRILQRDASDINLDQLGFSTKELQAYLNGVTKPNGIVLLSGPTGSGKTTTLYGTLKHLNKETTNILTIEDPIEYTLEGINQVQLKEDIGLTFPKALRTFLRQDPDIIMVGEIRDEKTANMAIKAALTGHLVLSTIHTNSAWSTISRLMDMGIPSFLIAETLNLSVAQRLIRRLCPNCKQAISCDNLEKKYQKVLPSDCKEIYTEVGCPHCFFTGYNGRIAIYEIISLDDHLRKAIKMNESLGGQGNSEDLEITTLKMNAIRKVVDGTTTFEEITSLL